MDGVTECLRLAIETAARDIIALLRAALVRDFSGGGVGGGVGGDGRFLEPFGIRTSISTLQPWHEGESVLELFFFDFGLNVVEQEFSGAGPTLFPADIWETAFFFVFGASFGRVFAVTLAGKTTLFFVALDKTFSSLIDDVLRAARDADFLATLVLERISLGFLGSSCNLDSRDREDLLDSVDFVNFVDLVDFVDVVDWV